MDYATFLSNKAQLHHDQGFTPLFMPDFLFDFQKYLLEWGIQKGRAAYFADCGMGKTPMQLVWAENVVRQTNKPVLIATPLAVGSQTVKEGLKFDIECHLSRDGSTKPNITVTNYEQLHKFSPHDFSGMVCDESSILKNFDGAIKESVTEFMRRMPYRLLCTATAAPNDYIEFGTSSEALGGLGYMDMLGMFFKNDQNSLHPSTRGRHNSAWYGCKGFRGWTGKQTENRYSHWIWRQYASAFWDDVRIDRVLPYKESKEPDDEKHVHPLQLDVIERVVILRSNPDEVVFTPFMGVGSEVYGAVINGRKAVGVELKASYYKQAVRNLEAASNQWKDIRENELLAF